MQKIVSVFMILGCLILTAESTITWDFAKGVNPSNPELQFYARGTTSTRSGSLYSEDTDLRKIGGTTSRAKYPALTPKGAFQLTAVITLEAPRSKQPFLIIWDNKGDFFDKKSGKKIDNSGFTFALYRTPDGKNFAPRAWFGFGEKTADIRGRRLPLATGKKYTVTLKYDGQKNVQFHIDGQKNAEIQVAPGGPIAPAMYKTTIGDRTVGNFFRFDGRIHSLTLTTP